jgi:phenylacetate-coenzyme A ligase PaaK-like adenylate-forming protein
LETFKSFGSKLYTVNDSSFTDIALELFRCQAFYNPVYKKFIENLSISAEEIKTLEQIPFLPISFFKTFTLKSGNWTPEIIFTSSGTTDRTVSQHAVQSLQFYLDNAQKSFEHFFGPITDYHFLALLPSYLERQGSSLIAMMNYFIIHSNSKHSSFYLHDHEKLVDKLQELKTDRRKTILWGVSFALLDLAERYQLDLSHCLVFETGGMKGRRKEITRFELRSILEEKLHVSSLFSEYGMTELLSQAYSKGNNQFKCPPWMKIICRELTDPFEKGLLYETGGINVIDLANWQTVSFIETEDLGKAYSNGFFEVLGRLDNSDVRGCNLMIQ